MIAAGAAVGFSVAGADSDPANSPAASETIVVDGVNVYRTELSDGGPALYNLDRPSKGDVATAEGLPEGIVGSGKWQTTGDFAACKLLVERPGAVVEGCALMLAQDQNGDLDLTEGPAQLVYSVCGREPGPGEIKACDGEVVTDAQVKEVLEELRAVLGEEAASAATKATTP